MNFEDKIAQIRLRFRARAQDEIAALKLDWLDGANHGTAGLEKVAARAHTLAGTASMLQLDDVAAAAMRVEQCVRQKSDILEIQDSVVALCHALLAIAPPG